ncbi:Uncharacterized protein APZ42_034004 [Daphnia magna]|uniref:Uncharacterized protein n=1 Tax=Daphnia magna TaxID=35525 RepID=A0A164KIZ9_9CRUS|nr:Uncharacterized protein APZ42_034004 [Daphnia magna]
MYVMGLLCIFMCITGSPVKYIKIWSYKSATALPPLSHMEHQRIPPSLYDVIVHDDERYRGFIAVWTKQGRGEPAVSFGSFA